MDKKTFAIGVLSITAVLLLIACLLPTAPATAAFSVKDRDYQLITTQGVQGSDNVYVVDNRTGMMAVLTYDVRARVMRPRKVGSIADAFTK